ncbi:helix-turn-helix domain-containing protein [Pyxidicoccus trucidator]|uniref:helix-turn-helix domain-containing protein n=1 Tax=Pyxidicoccus trucidator TaxID=2709662 RepID=UPI0013DA0C39
MPSARRPTYVEFVALLRRERRRLGVSQEELAKRLQRPQSFVSKAEGTERRLDFVETLEWCRALGVTLDDITPSEFRKKSGGA